MTALNPATQNTLPPPLQSLIPRELFLFTQIPLHLLEGFIKGTFKPNRLDREKLSDLSRMFYRWNESEIKAFVDRKKYREVQAFLSLAEKDNLFSQPTRELYRRNLDELLKKYWDQILRKGAQKNAGVKR